jgi:hypothetical protein
MKKSVNKNIYLLLSLQSLRLQSLRLQSLRLQSLRLQSLRLQSLRFLAPPFLKVDSVSRNDHPTRSLLIR